MLLKKVLLVACAFAAAPALATTPLPGAYYYYHFDNQDQMDGAAGSYSSGGAHVTFGLTPSPSVSLTAGPGGVTAGLKYYFRINGPDNVFVPVRVQGKLRADSAAPSDGQANAGAQIGFNGIGSSPRASIEHDAGGTNGGTTSADPLLTATVYTNDAVLISLQAFVNAGNKGSGFALADPIISIDPSFASYDPDYLSHYSLEFSPGAGNSVGGVPEPATWGLMLVGFGIAGTAMRRRAQLAVAAV
jgi:hypothetical protein